MSELPHRRKAENFDIGPFIISVGFDPQTEKPCEVFFVARGKSGTQLDDWLYEMGVTISKIMQNEN